MKFTKPVESLVKSYQAYGLKGIWASIEQKFREEVLDFRIRPIVLNQRIKHLHGPKEISYDSDELIVTCLVRNGELYIKSFMDHYLELGAKHFVFMDNVSTDRTVEMLSSYDCTTVLQTDVTFIKYENTIRRYMAERFSQDRWHVTSDIDELFDYPYSSQINLKKFLQYLNKYNYTAVVTQMLDMFSEIPFATLNSSIDDVLPEKYPYYDISNIDKTEYVWSEPNNQKIQMHWGGIRKTLFDTYSGLTKAALIKMDGTIKPFVGWHHAKNARLADISCVLKHYTFLATYYLKAKDAVETGRYGKKYHSNFYGKIWKVLESNPSMSPKLDTARHLEVLEQLIDENFVVISDHYRDWIQNNAEQDSQPDISGKVGA